MSQTNAKHFYDLDKIKQVPILEVCKAFGVELQPKGGKFWCKLRPERTASCSILTEKNLYHDFGSNETGDVIGLVSGYFGVDRYKAICLIAEAFSISPENTRSGVKAGELTVWEYEKIGLDGKMATRNFDFDLERQGFDRVNELSLRYAMPMNVLRSQNPVIFEKLLRLRALPHVKELRNEYYRDLYAEYRLSQAVSPGAFEHIVQNGKFNDQIKQLQQSEQILYRACQGTRINAWSPGQYDPIQDIEKLLSGEVQLGLGTKFFNEMKSLADKEQSTLKYRSVSIGGYLTKEFDLAEFSHTAFIKNGKVVVGYLEKDHAQIKPVLDQIRVMPPKSLNSKISDAQQKQGETLSPEQKPKDYNKGEER